MNPNFYANLYFNLSQNPAREVVVWPSGKGVNSQVTTAQDLLNRVTSIGKHLQKNGIRKGEKVMLLVPVGFELISSLLAIMAIGAVPVLPPAKASKTSLFLLLRKG